MTANEIAQLMANQTEQVCRILLPNGKRTGSEWKAGSINGEAGKSLCVKLTGTKAGVWSDFADSTKGGDLLDLWSQSKGISLSDAIKESKSYLGIAENYVEKYQQQFTRPQKPKCNTPKLKVLDWLKTERGLNKKSIDAYKLAEDGESVVFPSIRDGELVRWKSRNIQDKHKCKTSSNSEPCLFGWQAVPDDDRGVVICEGEIDALSWFQLGYPALSVPSGAQSFTWIENEYNNLERFDLIYLSMDMDKAGQKAIPEIVERLGRERVRVIDIPKPYKDANDLVKTNFQHIDSIVSRARSVDPKELRSASDYTNEIISEFWDEDNSGYATPWRKLDNELRFRKGEVIVLAGINKHGKSQAIGHITLDAISKGERACIASLEFKPQKWLKRLTRQASCVAKPTSDYIRAISEWYSSKLWVFDVTGTAKTKRMMEIFAYARKRYGVTTFVIDNLQKCDIRLEENDDVKEFIDQLTDFAKEHDVVVFLVHHMRKGSDESNQGKMGIKGSGAITDLVDTILIWWRNKNKEQKRKDAQRINAPFDESDEPDAVMFCEGQRNGESEPNARLWFDSTSTQFLEHATQKPKQYVQFSAAK